MDGTDVPIYAFSQLIYYTKENFDIRLEKKNRNSVLIERW